MTKEPGGRVIEVGGSGRMPESFAEIYGDAGRSLAVLGWEANAETLLSRISEEKRSRAGEALKRLEENLVRLHWRTEECRAAGLAIPFGYTGKKLPMLQLQLV